MRSASRNTTSDSHAGPDRGPAVQPLGFTKTPLDDAEREARSGFGSVPGDELPAYVYVSVLAAFGWIMAASWLAFARDMDAALALGIAIVLAIVFFALPVIIHHVAVTNSHRKPEMARDFLGSQVETATGPLPGTSAWVQVLIIPAALALAATLIGAAFLLVR